MCVCAVFKNKGHRIHSGPCSCLLYIYLSIDLISMYLSIYLSVSFFLSTNLSIYLSVYLLSFYPLIYIYIYLSFHPSFNLSFSNSAGELGVHAHHSLVTARARPGLVRRASQRARQGGATMPGEYTGKESDLGG